MSQKLTFYDSYDYPHFWASRLYEHRSEVIALNRLLRYIPRLKTAKLVDIGAGFGRLTPFYLSHVKSALLIDPSPNMQHLAKNQLSSFKNFRQTIGKAEGLPIPSNSFDLALCIRVFHHLQDPATAIKEIARTLKPRGFLILEFANRCNLKARLKAILTGNSQLVTQKCPLNRFTNLSPSTITFVNHHPEHISRLLATHNFVIKQILSVSNLRSPFFKRLPLSLTLPLERLTQSIFAKLWFGPSIFFLAQKRAA